MTGTETETETDTDTDCDLRSAGTLATRRIWRVPRWRLRPNHTVGLGTNTSEFTEAWISAIVPEPSAALLRVVCLVVIGARRRSLG
jgi:hypothetical protein